MSVKVSQFPELDAVIGQNKSWAKKTCDDEPEFFNTLAKGQVSGQMVLYALRIYMLIMPLLLVAPFITCATHKSHLHYQLIPLFARLLKSLTETRNPVDWLCRLSSARERGHGLQARRGVCSREWSNPSLSTDSCPPLRHAFPSLSSAKAISADIIAWL
jgi:hypothetical protein